MNKLYKEFKYICLSGRCKKSVDKIIGNSYYVLNETSIIVFTKTKILLIEGGTIHLFITQKELVPYKIIVKLFRTGYKVNLYSEMLNNSTLCIYDKGRVATEITEKRFNELIVENSL